MLIMRMSNLRARSDYPRIRVYQRRRRESGTSILRQRKKKNFKWMIKVAERNKWFKWLKQACARV